MRRAPAAQQAKSLMAMRTRNREMGDATNRAQRSRARASAPNRERNGKIYKCWSFLYGMSASTSLFLSTWLVGRGLGLGRGSYRRRIKLEPYTLHGFSARCEAVQDAPPAGPSRPQAPGPRPSLPRYSNTNVPKVSVASSTRAPSLRAPGDESEWRGDRGRGSQNTHMRIAPSAPRGDPSLSAARPRVSHLPSAR